MGVTRLFLPLGQYSWHLFYRLLSLEWGEGDVFQSVTCSVFKEENLFINEKYNTIQRSWLCFLSFFLFPLITDIEEKAALGPFCGLQSGCLHCSLHFQQGSPPSTPTPTHPQPHPSPTKALMILAQGQGFSTLELKTFRLEKGLL